MACDDAACIIPAVTSCTHAPTRPTDAPTLPPTHHQGTYELAYGVSDPGFVAVRANDSHLLLHFYVADQPLPTHTMVLAAVR